MKKELFLLYHPESNCYLLGGKTDNTSLGELENVTGDAHHERDACLFHGIIDPKLLQPETIANNGSEHSEQCALFAWANFASRYDPRLNALFAIPNGGSRGDSDETRKVAGGKMKAEGVKPGVPDMMLPIPINLHGGSEIDLCGLFIELKRKDGTIKDLSEKQAEWSSNLKAMGYDCVVSFGWIDARKKIVEYLELT
jgi:hypothetical protein